MSTSVGTRLEAYWRSKCASDTVPSRSDIDPSDIRALLPDLMIAELLPDDSVHFRLAGTRVTRRLGWEPTGSTVGTRETEEPLYDLAVLVRATIRNAEPASGQVAYPGEISSFDSMECRALPLCAAGGSVVSQALIAIEFNFAATSLAIVPGSKRSSRKPAPGTETEGPVRQPR